MKIEPTVAYCTEAGHYVHSADPKQPNDCPICRLPRVEGIPTPDTKPIAPYTVWMDNPCSGWTRTECETIEQCFHEMHAIGHSGDYRITRDVKVGFIELQENPVV